MRKKINGFICMILLVALATFPNTTAHAADDITGIGLEAEMRAMIEAEVIYGFGPDKYEPNLNVTRGQFATFLSRALDLPTGPAVFSDVPANSPLAPHINSAFAAGIVSGYTKTTFGPEKEISREQAAKMIARALETFKGVKLGNASIQFSDAADINQQFKDAVTLNAEHQIIRGLSNGDGTYRFLPKKTATRAEAAAFIARMLKVNGNGSSENSLYTISNIENGKISATDLSFEKFDSAKQRLANTNQVIVKNGKVVYMSEGLARTNSAIILYTEPSFTNKITNLSIDSNQELKFLEATEQYVRVQIANTTAFAKASEVTLIPTALVKERNYYRSESGELVHYVYAPTKNRHESYSMGKAPSFLTAGVEYYSMDGVEFFNESGTTVGKAYQYFNYLSARTTTKYTAEELNNYITQRLIEIEKRYTDNPTGFPKFKDATKRSKIIGFGTAVKEAEAKYGINALLILGIAMHEGEYGMSDPALLKNNLFGLSAVDHDPDKATTFATVEENIAALAEQFLNKNYIEPSSAYYFGAVLGNKSTGFNAKYASDPFWGQKIAGHMYRVDQFLGGKDFGAYRLAETKVDSVNVRANVGTNSFLQFEYQDANSPVTIKATISHTDNYEWYEVVSEVKQYPKAFIRSDVLTELPVAK